jgi:glutathione S-transferase
MQLYSIPFSPYAARCRIQIHHKQLPVEIVPPPGGLGSAQLREKNPIGKIPVLDLGERSLAESWAIMDYLESVYPQTPMRPADAYDRACLQALVRFTDLYLAPAMLPLFKALRAPATPEEIQASLAALKAQLATLESLLAQKPARNECPIDLADAALLPVLWYARILATHFGAPDLLAGLPATTDWWKRLQQQPSAVRVLDEMEQGLRQAIPVLFPQEACQAR